MFGSFLPSLGCLAAIKSTQLEGADIVMKSSGGANAVAGCWPTIRPSGFRDPWAFLITYVVKLPTRRLLHTKRGTLRTCEAEACDSPPRKTDLVSKTVQLSYLDGEIIVGSRDYP